MINWFKQKFGPARTYFTSDLHFGHKNVINYCNRPFNDLDEMHDRIIKVWNNTIRKKDIVYVLGDFSLNPKWSKLIVPKLNGYKILIAGNHDACHISNKKNEKFIKRYLEEWDEVHSQFHSINLKNNQLIGLSHLPYDNAYDSRYSEYKPFDIGCILAHGHLHGHYIKNGRQIDVSWDAHQKIISEDELISIIDDPREFIPSHLTEFYKNRKENKID